MPLRHTGRPAPATIPADPAAWLATLGGPVAIRVPGRDRGRCRAVVTLLHGNEPSGVRAVHGWLRDGLEPATDALIVVASVEAALAEQPFTTRQLPGAPDLNRLFLAPGHATPHGRLAAAILAAVLETRPEALVDIHNNSGHNPAYGVARRPGPAELALCALFGGIVVRYDLRLGALIEATEHLFPSVVVEAGRAGDPAADAVARAGLDRLLGESDLLAGAGARPAAELRLLGAPVRVEAAPGTTLAFGSGPGPAGAASSPDLVVDEEVDRHNFELLPAGTPLGWVREGAAWPLAARGADGREVSRALFSVQGGRLVAAAPLVPIMMTTDARIALSDCLFYAVREEPGSGGPTGLPD